ncbi:uncharacterized protein FIBRA_07365 [Fibroporia radiculosa]|uniref:F-box domain-containing protein n=1 Tax=Fibroporia radiculosa TaxID=599839 RepID=J4IBS2_9APHY|nr:uncharacterized protein FIBRA_07365 [Fibroporia radiculosa]CCM05156.1 predicted protein [Fibroporia radiculosa]
MATAPTFLGVPVEIRLVIYELYLIGHRHVVNNVQPSNNHICLLRTCRQIDHEARRIIGRYVSLRHERQINAFILRADDFFAAQVLWLDVANDGRVLTAKKSKDKPEEVFPLSNLHLALRRMTSVRSLRVFQCRRGLPVNVERSTNLRLKFEMAMYPSGDGHRFNSYELHLDPETRVRPFEVVPPECVEKLRLSGDCHFPTPLTTPALRHVTLCGVTGNFFDQNTISQSFPGSRLESFSYGQGHRLGFELRNHHLNSLVSVSSRYLRKLVLLGCSRLTSTVVASCLDNLVVLEYFAFALLTVHELRPDFVLSLPPSLSTFKLQVRNTWFAVPLLTEERQICDALEETVLHRSIPLSRVCVNFRDLLMINEGRREKWNAIAEQRHLDLTIGPWEDVEDI